MLLPHADAMRFIDGYKAVLLEVLAATKAKPKKDIVRSLADARARVAEDASWIDQALAARAARGEPVPTDIAKAVQSLRIGRWIHLRHTTKYALLLDIHGENAYAVEALTNPLHEIAGGTAVSFEAGVVEYGGRYVCDGIVLGPVHLGPNLRKELNQTYSRLKAAGRFHRRPGA